jgi:hypothetical protein
MTHSEARHARDRRQSDLLLDVVFAHMALSSAKDQYSRERARGWFREAVRKLDEFLGMDAKHVEAGKS